MTPLSGSKPRTEAERIVNPRRAARIGAEGLVCQLGEIQDLSETGMRIRSAGRPKIEAGSRLTLSVSSSLQRLSVRGQVVWVKKGLLSGTIGIRFVDTPPALARALVELALHGFVDPSAPCVGSETEPTGPDRVAGQDATGGHEGTSAGPDRAGAVRADVQMEDLYGALNVPPSATTEEIHVAYRALARQLHPDVNPSPDAAQRFAYVAKAYGVLRDPAQRLRYDERRRAARLRAA